jgi:hypothetical protein
MTEENKKKADIIITQRKVDVDVIITHDYWDSNGERIKAGEKITLPTDIAIVLLKEGKAERSLDDLGS